MNNPMGIVVGIFVITAAISYIMTVIVGRAEARRRMALDLHGRTVTATITSVRGDGINAYSVTAEWINPQTGAVYAFKGSSYSFRKGESVEVVFDPHNPRNCYFRRLTKQ